MIQKALSLLASKASIVVILTAIASFICPDLFAWVQQGQRASVILGLIMLTMGLTLEVEDFRQMLSRPLDLCIGACAQFLIMPLLAFGLSRLFNLDPYLSIGLILVGCCPGGVSSNIMSFLCGGDVAYSVGMTTVSTVLSPLVTPLLVLVLSGTEIKVDALGMFQNILLVTLLPVTLGVLLNWFMGRSTKRNEWNHKHLRPILPGLSVICLALIVGGVIFTVRPQLLKEGWLLIGLTLLVVTCHNALGYLLGYSVGRLFGFSTAKKRTLSLEVGMQNAGMATVLSRNFFATEAMLAINPMAALAVFPCAISCAYHSISGTILAGLFHRFDKNHTFKLLQKRYF